MTNYRKFLFVGLLKMKSITSYDFVINLFLLNVLHEHAITYYE